MTAPQTDLIRVYRPEWVIASVLELPDSTRQAADTALARLRDMFERNQRGRVRDDEVRFGLDLGVARMELRVPVLKGEFVDTGRAQQLVQEQGWSDAVIVQRHSSADHDLRNYGVGKL